MPILGATVQGTLERPQNGLGTALANSAISATQIDQFREKNPDTSPAAAKLQLLPANARPVTMPQTVTLRDDGKSGDQAAGDGIYGVLVGTDVPGSYLLTVRATYQTQRSGNGMREAAFATPVAVTVDGIASIKEVREDRAPKVGSQGRSR